MSTANYCLHLLKKSERLQNGWMINKSQRCAIEFRIPMFHDSSKVKPGQSLTILHCHSWTKKTIEHYENNDLTTKLGLSTLDRSYIKGHFSTQSNAHPSKRLRDQGSKINVQRSKFKDHFITSISGVFVTTSVPPLPLIVVSAASHSAATTCAWEEPERARGLSLDLWPLIFEPRDAKIRHPQSVCT